MAKTNPKSKQPFDIFGDARLGAAMQAATAPGADEAGLAPQPSVRPKTAARAEGQGAGSPPRSSPASSPPRSSSPPPPTPTTMPASQAEGSGQAPAPAVLAASSIEDHVPLKFEVPRSMRAEFQAFKAELSAALGGVALDNSNIGRALLAQILGSERARILEAAREIRGALERPRNDDGQAMAEFDARLVEVFKS